MPLAVIMGAVIAGPGRRARSGLRQHRARKSGFPDLRQRQDRLRLPQGRLGPLHVRLLLQDLRPLHVRLRRLKPLRLGVLRVLTAPWTALFAVKTLNGISVRALISFPNRQAGRAAL